ncbi:sigma factor-like helix-turn-helix DNA-binding protein [Desulfoscipio gibsoniae]|uniref:DNA-directed RNA polymerase specialized sigma subunit n=1 Tax=Desulfoscipio gibsoniae DSM 7213 TaxID=767817 RepID=R4KCG0_9FIRM|nr:sigma factor-like helix-turn-helix DNA-binding protein [Desulfoscipio gibsoniae]AGL00259.1 DNA-directed RNA polymerase specialized sigma subunit [Desulfoscipio gibsoniae DSM 7213]
MTRFVKIGHELVPVSEEVYKEYYRMARRERYMERDIKVGRIEIDPANETAAFIPSKEDSMNRLLEQGVDFADNQMIEDIICYKANLLILQNALAELNREEQELIQALYYKNRTVRQVARENNVSHVTVVKRHKKVLDKLRKFFI